MKHYIIFLLFCQSVFSQKDIIVIYDTYLTYGSVENDEAVKKSNVRYIYDGLDETIRNVQYEFHISEAESYFFFVDKIFPDERKKTLAKTFCGSANFYGNKKLDYRIEEKLFLDQLYFVKDTTHYNWNISNEQKQIDDKICFKATTVKQKMIKGKLKETLITAWFCPEIPISVGPKGFDGLPGLILEITEGKVTLVAKTIKTDEVVSIKEFDAKKIISQSEFSEIAEKAHQEFLRKFEVKE